MNAYLLLQNHITVVKICEQAKTNLAQASKLLEQTDKAPLVPYSLQQAENLLREATDWLIPCHDGEVPTARPRNDYHFAR